MLITLRLPRTSAMRLGLTVTGIGEHEVVVAMTTVELAGRLSLATGKVISPEAVVDYCVAWRAANERLAGLVKKHGKTRLPRIVSKACMDRALWAPRRNTAMLEWLQCVLESYFLSGQTQDPTAPRPGAYAAEQHEAHHDMHTQEPDTAEALAVICEAHFPLAYRLWTAIAD